MFCFDSFRPKTKSAQGNSAHGVQHSSSSRVERRMEFDMAPDLWFEVAEEAAYARTPRVVAPASPPTKILRDVVTKDQESRTSVRLRSNSLLNSKLRRI